MYHPPVFTTDVTAQEQEHEKKVLNTSNLGNILSAWQSSLCSSYTANELKQQHPAAGRHDKHRLAEL